MAIYFFNEDISFQLADESKTISWLTKVIKLEGFSLQNINYIFCSDKHLLDLNQTYLNHDTLTDIITFDNSEIEKTVDADIFISIERVRENASELNSSFENELERVLVHGVLHLIGLSDKTNEEKQVMREKEDACLSLR